MLPQVLIMPSLVTPALNIQDHFKLVTAMLVFCFAFVLIIVPWVFLILPACSLIGFLSSILLASQGFLVGGKIYGWFHTRGT